jgi:hypothetical protein
VGTAAATQGSVDDEAGNVDQGPGNNNPGASNPVRGTETGTRRSGTTLRGTSSGATGTTTNGTSRPGLVSSANRDFNVVQIERELAVQRLASSRKLLNERRGEEFDFYFLAQQIAMQKKLRDELIVYQRHVSPALAEIFMDGEQASDQHLARAIDLIRTIPARSEPAGAPRAAARPERSAVTGKR